MATEKVQNEDDARIDHFLQVLTKQGTLGGFCSMFQTVYIAKDPPPLLGRCASIMSISQVKYFFGLISWLMNFLLTLKTESTIFLSYWFI